LATLPQLRSDDTNTQSEWIHGGLVKGTNVNVLVNKTSFSTAAMATVDRWSNPLVEIRFISNTDKLLTRRRNSKRGIAEEAQDCAPKGEVHNEKDKAIGLVIVK